VLRIELPTPLTSRVTKYEFKNVALKLCCVDIFYENGKTFSLRAPCELCSLWDDQTFQNIKSEERDGTVLYISIGLRGHGKNFKHYGPLYSDHAQYESPYQFFYGWQVLHNSYVKVKGGGGGGTTVVGESV
jgi:hypothetical protein